MTKLHKRMLCILFLAAIALAACSHVMEPVSSKADTGMSARPSSSETPATSLPEPDVSPPKSYIEAGGNLELPVTGATGWASIALEMKKTPAVDGETELLLEAGTVFCVLQEEGDWWQVDTGKATGWITHTWCFVNLPDVVPSIVYDCTNTYSSLFVSSGKEIPGITGEVLYDGKAWNERLGREEFIVPVLYAMSKKICAAQQLALADGDTLKIHEGYRPFSTQLEVVNAVSALAETDAEVLAGISSPPWSINWFIATGISNHQVGYAIDVTLARVEDTLQHTVGEWGFTRVNSFTEYAMQTPLHELSIASATYTAPVASSSPTAWREATYAEGMNDAAKLLQKYCTDGGLSPLASEWWHFNDLDAMTATLESPGGGGFVADTCVSTVP